MTDRLPPPLGEAEWEDSPRQSPTDAAPTLVVDGFAGPIDWLVEQVRAGRIDLARLSVAALVDAFGDALAAVLNGADKRPGTLARWGAWLVLAAELTFLCSRLLVPAGSTDAPAAVDRAEALWRQVRERAAIAAAADWLERRQQLGRDVWARGQPEIKATVGRVGDVTGFLRACLVALRVPDEAEAAFRVRVPFWSLADAVTRIRAMLPEVGEGGAPLERFLPEVKNGGLDYELRCRAAVAGTFLGGLELAREGVVALQQDGVWNSIRVGRGNATAQD